MTIATTEALSVTEFPETEFERSLRRSLDPLAIEVGHSMTDHPWVCDFVGAAGPTADFLKAVGSVRPLPKRLAGVWAEHQDWQALQAKRVGLDPGYHHPPHVAARVPVLEHLMDTLPDPTSAGMRARFAWLQHIAQLDHYRTNEEDTALSNRIAADFDQLCAMSNLDIRHSRARPRAPRRIVARKSCPFSNPNRTCRIARSRVAARSAPKPSTTGGGSCSWRPIPEPVGHRKNQLNTSVFMQASGDQSSGSIPQNVTRK